MTRFREPVSGFLHLGGAILALVGLIVLVAVTWDDPAKMVSVLIYGCSLVLVFSASTALHLTYGSPRTLLWLNRVDHASIYVLIAGTYTPFCFQFLTGAWRWGMLVLVWTLAVSGVIYKLAFFRASGNVSTALYVAMGWIGILGAPKFIATVPIGAIGLLIAAGIIYSLGAVIFALERPNFHHYFNFHDLWHVFVLAGSAILFVAIARYVV